ncbi:hd phosphohydrolase domain protein [Pandoravirus inopinatum]|uniref:Hd phosphohydrolase domain protein n=1 Tax=Pandoravirus inopinatum TaxID=1605721 RepID=A0A0B5JC01_9VIRU|nr:hd phosphohydrolase domain protein [Pandoravirus inopinatum]AJF98566.1 hd phosphohydrolase domain protein [Pandoravirus inopinatum]
MAGRWMAHFVQQQAFVAERLAGLRLKAAALECTIDRAKDRAAALSPDALADAVRCLDRTRLKIASLEDRVVAISKDDVFLVQVAALCHDLGASPFFLPFFSIFSVLFLTLFFTGIRLFLFICLENKWACVWRVCVGIHV